MLRSVLSDGGSSILAAMQRTTATPEQVVEAMRINTDARLRALKIGLLIMAGVASLMILPSGRLPNYLPGEIPAGTARRERNGTKTVS